MTASSAPSRLWCAPRRSPCCRRYRRRHGGEQRLVLAFHRPRYLDRIENLAAPAAECRRAWRYARRPRGEGCVETAVAWRRGCLRPWRCEYSIVTPRSRIRFTPASRISRGSRYLGMPKRIMPPGAGWLPRSSRQWPGPRQMIGGRQADGPAPTTRIFFGRRRGGGLECPSLRLRGRRESVRRN